jgi:hypothetical protein
MTQSARTQADDGVPFSLYTQGYRGCAIGKGRQLAKTEIEKLKLEELTVEEALVDAARMCVSSFPSLRSTFRSLLPFAPLLGYPRRPTSCLLIYAVFIKCTTKPKTRILSSSSRGSRLRRDGSMRLFPRTWLLRQRGRRRRFWMR